MKITFELKDNILDEDSINNLSFLTQTVRKEVARSVENKLAEIYLSKAKFEDLGITKEDIKAAVLDRIVERALNKDNAWED